MSLPAMLWRGPADSGVHLHSYLDGFGEIVSRSFAFEIADDGTIIGDADIDSNYDTVIWTPVSELVGDFDGYGVLGVARKPDLSNAAVFDLNDDGLVGQADRTMWVEDLFGTFPGDADLSKKVEFADFLILSQNFSADGGWGEGDFDGSGDVQLADFLLLSSNFGKSVSAAAVPEPSGVVMLLLGLLRLVSRQRN